MANKKKPDAALARKVRENRIRRAAVRQGLKLAKAPQRDPHGAIYGTYGLIDRANSWVYLGNDDLGFGLTLDEVEAWLNTPPSRRTPEGAAARA